MQDSAKLRRLIVDRIDKEQWSALSADVKGDAYEGFLQKNAEDVKAVLEQFAAIAEDSGPETVKTKID